MPTRPPVHRPAYSPTPEQAKAKRDARLDTVRGSATERGYDKQWRKLRDMKLAASPWCEHCAARGFRTAATCVDHIKPVSHWPWLRLVWGNLASSCASCNRLKAITDAQRYGASASQGRSRVANATRQGGGGQGRDKPK